MISNIHNKLKSIENVSLKGEEIFLFMFVITLISSFLVNTTFAQFIPVKVFNRINYFTMFVLALKIYILDHYDWERIFVITAILLLVIYSWRKTTYINVMVMVTYMLAAKDVDFNKVIKYYFATNLILIVGITLYSLMGIIKNLSYSRNGIIRFALGIDYPTDYAAYVFYLILAFSYLNYRKLNLKSYFLYAIIAIILNIVTNARLDFILILLTIPVFVIARSAENGNIYSRYFASSYWSQILILPYVYFLLTYYYSPNNHLFLKLNNLLSGRLWYGHEALVKYPIKLLSQNVYEHGWGGVQGLKLFKQAQEKYFFIDSSFIRLLIIYGIIITFLIITIMLLISLKETINHSYLMPAIILLISVSSLIDQHMLEITYNPFFIILYTIINRNSKVGKL